MSNRKRVRTIIDNNIINSRIPTGKDIFTCNWNYCVTIAPKCYDFKIGFTQSLMILIVIF